jgi:hypothetical protein
MSGANECSTTPVIQQDPNRALKNLRKAQRQLNGEVMERTRRGRDVQVTCRVGELSFTTRVLRSHRIQRGAGDLLFPLPCQRPEGALAGRSRSSCSSLLTHAQLVRGDTLSRRHTCCALAVSRGP